MSIILKVLLTVSNCNNILCSNVIDQVCGVAKTQDGAVFVKKYLNLCHMRREACELETIADVYQVPDALCGFTKNQYHESGRRLNDFSIVGAYQACNHTCPTFCLDTYDPACALIWNIFMNDSRAKTMINHCHIDLFSCTTGFNVTILPLSKCFINPSALVFMTQVAALKSLKLVDDHMVEPHPVKIKMHRRSNIEDSAEYNFARTRGIDIQYR